MSSVGLSACGKPGNKRTGLACALVFLELNGAPIEDPEQRLYQPMMDIVTGAEDKLGLANILRSLSP